MRKTGGILILCATVFGLILNIAASAFFWLAPSGLGTDAEIEMHSARLDTIPILLGSLLISALVITLAIILLNTSGQWPAVSILAVALLSIWQGWGGGIMSLAMIISGIGALVALRSSRPQRGQHPVA